MLFAADLVQRQKAVDAVLCNHEVRLLLICGNMGVFLSFARYIYFHLCFVLLLPLKAPESTV